MRLRTLCVPLCWVSVVTAGLCLADEPFGVPLMRPDSLAGWDYGSPPTGWTISAGRLSGTAAATPLLSGFSFGDFELRLQWSAAASGAMETLVPRGAPRRRPVPPAGRRRQLRPPDGWLQRAGGRREGRRHRRRPCTRPPLSAARGSSPSRSMDAGFMKSICPPDDVSDWAWPWRPARSNWRGSACRNRRERPSSTAKT